MAAGDFLPLAQSAFARCETIIPDFVGRRHRRIGEAQKVGRELVATMHAERIGLLGECDSVLLATRKAPNHDARQTILALEPYHLPPIPFIDDPQPKGGPLLGPLCPIRP